MRDDRLSVGVGFDGSEHARSSLPWADDEILHQGRRLLVVSAAGEAPSSGSPARGG